MRNIYKTLAATKLYKHTKGPQGYYSFYRIVNNTKLSQCLLSNMS